MQVEGAVLRTAAPLLSLLLAASGKDRGNVEVHVRHGLICEEAVVPSSGRHALAVGGSSCASNPMSSRQAQCSTTSPSTTRQM